MNKLKSCLISLIMTVVLITVIEVGARLYLFSEVPFTPQDSAAVVWYTPEGLGDFQPNRNSIYIPNPLPGYPGPQPYSLQTNSQGLRAIRDYALPKPSGVTRILCIGDSFTEGALVNDFDTYPALLNSKFLKEPNFEIINAGHSAYGISEEFAYFTEKGAKLQPDIVVLQVLNNDIWSLYQQLFQGKLSDRPKTDRSWLKNKAYFWLLRHSALARIFYWRTLRSRWQTTLDKERLERASLGTGDFYEFIYRNKDAEKFAETLKEYEHQFLALKGEIEKNKARLVVVHPPDYMQLANNSSKSNASGFFTDLTARHGVPYVDLLPRFEGSKIEPDLIYLMPENGHLSRVGNWLMAKSVADAIIPGEKK